VDCASLPKAMFLGSPPSQCVTFGRSHPYTISPKAMRGSSGMRLFRILWMMRLCCLKWFFYSRALHAASAYPCGHSAQVSSASPPANPNAIAQLSKYFGRCSALAACRQEMASRIITSCIINRRRLTVMKVSCFSSLAA
jgi:hypothetical protein